MRPFLSSPVRARASQTNSAIVLDYPRKRSISVAEVMGQSRSGGLPHLPHLPHLPSSASRTAQGIASWVVESGVAPMAACGCAARDATGAWRVETGGSRETPFDLAS